MIHRVSGSRPDVLAPLAISVDISHRHGFREGGAAGARE